MNGRLKKYDADAATKLLATLCCGIWLVGCAQPTIVDDARLTFNQGKVDESLAELRDALAQNPRDTSLRVAYLTLRERAINGWLQQAGSPAAENTAGEQAKLYRRVLAVDPDNSRARAGLEGIERDARLSKAVLDAQFAIDTKDYALALAKVRSVLTEQPHYAQARALLQTILDKTAKPAVDPGLAQALQRTLNIDFKDATLRQVFDVLSKTAEINFVVDKDIKSDQRTSLSLKDVTVKEAVDLVMLSNQLEQRIQGRNAILIYPNTPAKQKDYQPLSVRTFFLANADSEQVANALRTVLKMRDVVVDKAQSLIILRDVPSALQMAEKLVTIEDLPRPETMIEVEVLEVNRDRLSALGIQFPPSLSLSPLPLASGAALTLKDLRNLRWDTIGASVAPTTINASGTDTDVKTLATPRIRVANREVAKILIGDRVPNITSTATSTGFVSENIQYLDVGLKVELTPTITIDNEVALKVSLEVSNIARQITTPSGTTAYQIGTRSASTVLRLKDGENQVLAGLINEQDNRTLNKVPGLGDLPIAGRLFSSETRSKSGSEIVLSITPRLIRNTPRPGADLLEFESGTESSLRGSDMVPPGSPAQLARQGAAPVPGIGTASTGALDRPNVQGTPQVVGGGVSVAPNVNAPSPAASASRVGLSWSGPLQVTAGASFSQSLLLHAPQALSGMTLTLGYDPAALQVTSVAEGNLLNADGTPTTFIQRVDPATGQIYISDVRASTAARGAVGQGTVVTVTFAAASAGGGPAQIRVLSVDATAQGGAGVSLPLPPVQTVTIARPSR